MLSQIHRPRVAVRRIDVLLLVLVVLYGLGFLALWLSDPLAQSPVLDARENLVWAQKIEVGAVPSEPFYRALLYPWLLAKVGWAVGISGGVAACLGLLCHFLNAALVAAIARRLWHRPAAAFFAGVVYACYPVSLWFAVQVLDISLAISLFLLGLYALLRSNSARSVGWLLLAGVAAGLALVTRPNFLPPVLMFPFLAGGMCFIAQRKWAAFGLAFGWVALPLLGVVLVQGGLNYQRSGEFRVLPWQGAYNLYAANRSGVTGKYFQQQVAFAEIPAGSNPTRMESEYLYRRAHEPTTSLNIAEMNAYWQAEFRREVSADPLNWLGLMGRKAVYFFNDWEQYNNLTYAYHKARFALLNWNPLGWGVLMLGAGLVLTLGWCRVDRIVALSVLMLAAAYAAGVLMFFVSARFRLPLAPLLCVFAGGVAVLPWRSFSRRKWLCLLAGLGLGSLLIYGNWFQARDRSTYVQDELLLASANYRLSQDEQALYYAEAALVRNPQLPAAREIQIAALFFLWTQADSSRRSELWSQLAVALTWQLEPQVGLSQFIHGLYSWRQGDLLRAKELWQLGSEDSTEAGQWCADARAIAAGQVPSGESSDLIRRWMGASKF